MVEAKVQNFLPEQLKAPGNFLEMLSSPKFQEALKIAARHTSKTGLETAFEVLSMPDFPCWIENVRAGGTDRMGENAKPLKELDGDPDFNLPIVSYFSFHFHPRGEGIAIPSPSDFTSFMVKDRSDQPEYIGVGEVDKQGKISIFIVAKPKYRLIGYDIELYQELVDKVRDYGELQNLLRTIGLSSFVVELNLTR